MNLIPWSSRRKARSTVESGETTNLLRLRNEVDRLFDRFFESPFGAFDESFGRLAEWNPSMDVAEKDDEITVRAEIPGVDPAKTEVTLSGNFLTISGRKEESEEETSEDFFHCERRFGSFKRSIELPATAEPDRITAECANGVLVVRVPKKESAKARQIEVETKPEHRARKKVPVGAA